MKPNFELVTARRRERSLRDLPALPRLGAFVLAVVLAFVVSGCSEPVSLTPRSLEGIGGRVVDAAGTPRPEVAVTAYASDHRPDGASSDPVAAIETGSDGFFELGVIPIGTYNLFASSDALGDVVAEVVVSVGADGEVGRKHVDFVLAPLGQVVGTALTSDEAPLEGAEIAVLGSPFFTVAGTTGDFVLPVIPGFAYDIVASLGGYRDAVAEDVLVGPGGTSSVGPMLLVAEGGTYEPGQPVGEWFDVPTYLDVRELGTTTWFPRTGFARLQPLDMGRAVHTVELTGLRPGTEYEFRLPYDPLVAYPVVVGDPTTAMTIHWQTPVPLHEFQPRPTTDDWVFRFRTFPGELSDTPVRIGFGGDIKQSEQPYETYAQVFDAYLAQDLHALVITGDWAYDDNLPFKDPTIGDNRFADLWDTYKDHGTDGAGRLTPIVPGIGNHEVAGGYLGEPYDWDTRTLGENTVFAVQFPTVPSRWYYAVDIADYATIVVLDSEHVNPSIGSSADAQTAWLEGALADRRDVPSVFVTYHVAAYPVTRTFDGGTARRIRSAWHPLFDGAGNISLAFEMHDHAYGESHWIRGGQVVSDGTGIKYLGAGHMGTFQNRSFWNPATTWYLRDAYGYQAKEAESGVPHPDDGKVYDATGEGTRHIWIVELSADERRVRSFMIDGTSRVSFTY